MRETNVQKINVIVISSVRPEPTTAGQIILHRHLVDQPGISLEVYGDEPKRSTLSKLIRRIAGRLGKGRLKSLIEDCWVLWEGRWIDAELPERIADPQRTIVLTVAHGDGFMAAQRFAKRHKLPLVSIFHDWWPDMTYAHSPFRSMLERKFKTLARESSVTFCVCKGMQVALGSVPQALILPPISAAPSKILPSNSEPRKPFKILYSGNMGDYGPMLGDALEESLKHPDILLQVRGASPNWSEERKAKMRANGRWLDFAPRAELDAWLASADAFLVPMVFDDKMRKRMETSFPSKLVEFAQLGKPLIIWGPEYCSAIQWSGAEEKAICITSPSVAELLKALLELKACPNRLALLKSKTKKAAEAEFNPILIQTYFYQQLSGAFESRVQ